jgi:hypothetical protein
VLSQEVGRDQIAADHEEDVDAEEAAAGPADVGVIQQHGDDSQAPQPVEARDAP